MQIKQKPVQRDGLRQPRDFRLIKIKVLDVLRLIDVQREYSAEVIDANDGVRVRARSCLLYTSDAADE